jgi:hypothetical protein
MKGTRKSRRACLVITRVFEVVHLDSAPLSAGNRGGGNLNRQGAKGAKKI